MTKLEKIENKKIVALVNNLIKERITKTWLKDILLGKRFQASHFFGDCSEAEFFDICIWDNLSNEQQNKAIESLNLLIEEDLFADKAYEGNYCFYLLELAISLEQYLPGKINTKPFLIWKEKNYPNLSQPIDHNHYVIKNLDQKIERFKGSQ